MGNCLGNPGEADSLLMSGEDGERQFALGQDQPLRQEQEVWTSEVPLTDGALQGKRDTFWETAPMYEGRKEIWDALRAACEAVGEEDYELAQAILGGANISLPRGQLTEAYDELGSRYVIPKYCISRPTNMSAGQDDLDNEDDMFGSHDQEPDSTTQLLQGPPSPTSSSPSRGKGTTSPSDVAKKRKTVNSAPVKNGGTMVVKVRLSTLSKDIKVTLPDTARVRDLKRRIASDHSVDAKKTTMLYSGRVLNNGTLLKDLDIPKGFVIQAIVSRV